MTLLGSLIGAAFALVMGGMVMALFETFSETLIVMFLIVGLVVGAQAGKAIVRARREADT